MGEPVRWITKNGRRIPITGGSGKSGKALVAGVVAAGVLVFAGTGEVGSIFASRAGTGSSAGTQQAATRKDDAAREAQRGDARGAWGRLGMRELKRTAKKDARCVAASFGQVRTFFLHTPCTSLDRMLFAVGDGRGDDAVISVAWVGFRTRGQAGEFKQLIDVPGTGDISPLASGLLGLADIRFTARHYGSVRTGSTVTIAEAEPARGRLDDGVLKGLAEVAARLPRP